MGQWVRADLRPATGTRGDAYASPSPVPVYVCRDEDEALGCFRAAPALACAVCAVPQPAQTRRLLKRRRGRRAHVLVLFRQPDGSVGFDALRSVAVAVVGDGDGVACEASARDAGALAAAVEALEHRREETQTLRLAVKNERRASAFRRLGERLGLIRAGPGAAVAPAVAPPPAVDDATVASLRALMAGGETASAARALREAPPAAAAAALAAALATGGPEVAWAAAAVADRAACDDVPLIRAWAARCAVRRPREPPSRASLDEADVAEYDDVAELGAQRRSSSGAAEDAPARSLALPNLRLGRLSPQGEGLRTFQSSARAGVGSARDHSARRVGDSARRATHRSARLSTADGSTHRGRAERLPPAEAFAAAPCDASELAAFAGKALDDAPPALDDDTLSKLDAWAIAEAAALLDRGDGAPPSGSALAPASGAAADAVAAACRLLAASLSKATADAALQFAYEAFGALVLGRAAPAAAAALAADAARALGTSAASEARRRCRLLDDGERARPGDVEFAKRCAGERALALRFARGRRDAGDLGVAALRAAARSAARSPHCAPATREALVLVRPDALHAAAAGGAAAADFVSKLLGGDAERDDFFGEEASCLTALRRHVEYCLDEAQPDHVVLHGLDAVHVLLDAARKTDGHAAALSAVASLALRGGWGLGGPLAVVASRLDDPRRGSDAVVAAALRPSTLALLAAADGDVADCAPAFVPLHVEALRDADGAGHLLGGAREASIAQLRSLLLLAARARPGDCVDAFRFCDAVPWLLELLGPPDCSRSLAASSREPSTPVALEPLAASFEAGDGVLVRAEAKNGRERWFKATVEQRDGDAYDIAWKSGGGEMGVPAERVRAPRGDRRRPPSGAPPRPRPTTPAFARVLDGGLCSPRAPPGAQRVPALRLSPVGPAPPDGFDDLWCLDVPVGAASSRPATDRSGAGLSLDVASARRMTRSLSIGGGDEPTPSLSCITGGALSPSPRTPGDPLLEFDVPPLLPGDATPRAASRRRRAPPALDDDELHELVVTLLLVLAVGRSSGGGELEPAFCTAHPLSDTGTGIRSHPDRRLSASALRSLNESPMTPTGLRPEHRRSHGALTGRSQSLTARSLSARSALVSARGSPDGASSEGNAQLLEVGTEGSALGFHLLDALHRHCNGGDRAAAVDRCLAGVARRLEAWGAAAPGSGRPAGCLRLLRLLREARGDAGAALRKALGREHIADAVLGRGRFGVVVALDGATCAKLLRRERSHRDRSVAHGVFAEVSALARLKETDAAPRLLDFGVVDDCYVLVLERCAHGTLFDWREARKSAGSLTDGDCRSYARVFAKVARRVAACAERRVVHLDLKLENVLLRGDPLDGPDGALCVCDFGEARLLGPSGDARITRAHGTEAVAAPEVVLGVQQSAAGQAAPVGPPADVWALGCLLYELVAGRKLFEAAVASDWPLFFVTLTNEAAPLPHEAALEPLTHLACKPALLDLLQTALRRDPAARDTAGQLAANADLFADGRPLVLRPAPPGPPRRLSSV